MVAHEEGRIDHPYEFLIYVQEKQLKMESETIFYLRKEMDCKQRTIAVCLRWESLIRDENFFSCRTLKLIQIYKTLINQNFLLLKIIKHNTESIDDNSYNSNECNKIPDQELSNKIANDNSKSRCPENCPRSGSGFGLGLALELGLGDNFPRTAKTKVGLIRITRMTLIALATQKQSNMMLAEMI